ncbi:MAG: leucine-rich repeat domain-containing protein [Sulfurovum sp.]|nr:leucine-rich repeat domain-containing protein [Sulfurovum sp.]
MSNFEFDNSSARLLPNLKSLNLTDCDLYGLPVEIGASMKLERVDISNNNLIEIPDAFKYLKQLKKLNIYGNNDIKTFPIWLKYLENLEEIDISYTSISDIPEAILKLKKLKVIYAKGCKFSLLKMSTLKIRYKGATCRLPKNPQLKLN